MTKEVESYHVGNDVKSAVSFLRDGILPAGKGVGGQSSGFYAFASLEQAQKHIKFKKNDDYAPRGGLLVTARVPLKDIQYPNWQFDLEASPCLMELAYKWRDEIVGLGEFSCADENGKMGRFLVRKVTDYDSFSVKVFPEKPGEWTTFVGLSTEGDDVSYRYVLQHIFDTMCERYPACVQEYNEMLKAVALNPGYSGAFKYTGKEPLRPSRLHWLNVGNGGAFIQRQIYPSRRTMSEPEKAQEATHNTLMRKKMDRGM